MPDKKNLEGTSTGGAVEGALKRPPKIRLHVREGTLKGAFKRTPDGPPVVPLRTPGKQHLKEHKDLN